MNLSTARKYAEKIVAGLTPFCHRIEIAGSIRRKRPVINDIDLVILPRSIRAIKRRCMQTHPKVLADGSTNFSILLRTNVQIDIYFAEAPETDLFGEGRKKFGSLFLCRTGSKQFNIWLALEAQKRSFHWNPYYGLYRNGQCFASETEQKIFSRLQLDFIPPELREK